MIYAHRMPHMNIKVIDLHGVHFKEMESHINAAIDAVKADGKDIADVKIIGESLGRCAVFVLYK